MSNQPQPVQPAGELLQDALVIDGHNDSIVAHVRRRGKSLLGEGSTSIRHSGTAAFAWEHEDMWPEGELQLDIPRMKQAGLDVGFFAVDVTPAFPSHLSYAMDCFGFLLDDIDGRDDVQIVRSVADIQAAHARGATGVLLAIEHADATARSLNVLRALYEVGVRAIGLTHNMSSWAADGCGQAREGVGLTPYGVALVQEMNRLGMVVDLAHVSPGAFASAIEVSDRPVIFSHGNAHALCGVVRNLTDDQLRALRGKQGVIGLSFVKFFVDDDEEKATMDRWVDHAVHVAEVAGIETVGLGSDFDGGGMLLDDVTELPALIEVMQKRGFSDDELRAILGGNMLRVLQATIG